MKIRAALFCSLVAALGVSYASAEKWEYTATLDALVAKFKMCVDRDSFFQTSDDATSYIYRACADTKASGTQYTVKCSQDLTGDITISAFEKGKWTSFVSRPKADDAIRTTVLYVCQNK